MYGFILKNIKINYNHFLVSIPQKEQKLTIILRFFVRILGGK